jgi:hypothetical protein
MQAFNKSYLGLATVVSNFIESLESTMEEGNLQKTAAAMMQPMPEVRRECKKQLKGETPPTDLLYHAPSSAGKKGKDMLGSCDNPECPNWNTGWSSSDLSTCTRCNGIYYCSVSCQHNHWQAHKPAYKKQSNRNKQQDKFLCSCGNPECPNLNTGSNSELSLCSRCNGIYYCSASCQHNHWQTHKPACKKQSKWNKKQDK